MIHISHNVDKSYLLSYYHAKTQDIESRLGELIYVKRLKTYKMKNDYLVKPEDIKGYIEGFPIEVVQWMVDEQVRQGNEADVTVFQRFCGAPKCNGGFNWDGTVIGFNDCHKIIGRKNFDLFFQYYPNYLEARKPKVEEPNEDKYYGLPELKAVEMDVSNNKVKWKTVKAFGYIKGMVVDANGDYWKYCRPVQPVKLTRAEIAEKFDIGKDFILED